ncbi:hypothetical protein BX661DRAFT_169221 [Kickxella alabastrina]|uniref:uncharacterized protein n=1 Tax=Kickxella alabastrina TaxID=61397 RepID=UPI00221EF67F|nr:uncharacterized protein BX661DRAFT_169221 [Kickxella alabastrina]KAI7833373.1 hypothetical protein BX661DRAFT_169221 [Kickxella alabastrina]
MSSISVVCTVMRTIIATRRDQDYAGFVAPAAVTAETLEDVEPHTPSEAEPASLDTQVVQLSAKNKLLDSQAFEMVTTHAAAESSLCHIVKATDGLTIKAFTRPKMLRVKVQALRHVFDVTDA